MAKKLSGPQIATANRLHDGLVVFLTADGEKPDRHRDREFVIDGDTRETLTAAWEAGWQLVFDAVGSLSVDDLDREVTIRGQKHSVSKAVNRQLTHYAYHIGQIVSLAQQLAADDWRWLSIPPGKSAEFEVSKEGDLYSAAAGDRS